MFLSRQPLLVILFLCAILLCGPVAAQTTSSQAEGAINEALTRQTEMHSLFTYREIGRTLDSNLGGVVYLELISPDGNVIPGLIDWMMVGVQAGRWRAYLPGESGYQLALQSFPTALRETFDDSAYRLEAQPGLVEEAALAAYSFPWTHGAFGTVTRSFNQHGIGQIDVDLTGREVAAAKDGVIIYANDSYPVNGYNTGAWWYWNTVVIQHGEHEYSLYGHLEPGSIPQAIKNACSKDLSRSNCLVPVRAGEVIALEGTSGYSSNNHLHLELGQAFDVLPYPDMADADGDGDRHEATYTAYIYAGHNIGFSGYTPDEAAGWDYGTLHQAAHGQILPDTNVIRNGDFSMETQGWLPSGQINWWVDEGMMRALRIRTSESPDWAEFYQIVDNVVPAHTPVEFAFQLGNSSTVEKRVTVNVMNGAGRDYGVLSCRFVLPPNASLQPFVLRGQAPSVWANIRVEFNINPADSAPAVLVDNVRLRRIEADPTETACLSLAS